MEQLPRIAMELRVDQAAPPGPGCREMHTCGPMRFEGGATGNEKLRQSAGPCCRHGAGLKSRLGEARQEYVRHPVRDEIAVNRNILFDSARGTGSE